MTRSPVERLELIEQHLDALRREVTSVRSDLGGEAPAARPAAAADPLTARSTATTTSRPDWSELLRAPARPTGRPAVVPASAKAGPASRGIELERLFGASGLAWAGGVITLLGIVFFFVMAASRGWIDPPTRVLLGGAASVGLVGVASAIRTRLGSAPAAIAAAGAGIAGALTAVVASTRLYGLVPDAFGLMLALLVAAGGVALASAWNAEPLAAFGLGGAAVTVPIVESGATLQGGWFALAILAAAAAVGVARGWIVPIAVAGLAAVPQVVLVAARHEELAVAGGLAVVLSMTCWGVLTGAAVAFQRRGEDRGVLAGPVMALVGAGLATALVAVLSVFEREVPGLDPQGVALLVLGAAYAAGAIALLRRDRSNVLVTVFGAIAVAMEAAGVGELLGGPGRVVAFAAQAGALAWLADRLGERRLRVAAAADVALAAVFALVLMPPSAFVHPDGPTLGGILGAAAVSGALGLLAWTSDEEHWRPHAAVASGVAGLYAASMGVLALVQVGQNDGLIAMDHAFQRGQMAVSVLWGLVGLGAVLHGVRRGTSQVRVAGVAVLALSIAKLFLYDLSNLQALTRAIAFFLVGGALLAGGAVLSRLDRDEPTQSSEVN